MCVCVCTKNGKRGCGAECVEVGEMGARDNNNVTCGYCVCVNYHTQASAG